MRFAEFLENQNTIQFGGFSRDGTVIVYINGQRYVFVTDAVYHDKWRKMIRFKPWAVLNDIKDMVRRGLATQEEPQENNEIKRSGSTIPQSGVQKKLF